MEIPLERAWVGLQVGQGKVCGNHQGGQTVIARLMEIQVWHPPVNSLWGKLSQGTMNSANTSLWEKAAHPVLTLLPYNLIPPCMSFVPFELLPQCWHRTSESNYMCGPFKSNIWDSRSPPPHSATTPAGFQSQDLWGLFFLALEPWAGEVGVGL